MLSKGQDRVQKAIRHYMAWFVFVTVRFVAFKTHVMAANSGRAQSPSQ